MMPSINSLRRFRLHSTFIGSRRAFTTARRPPLPFVGIPKTLFTNEPKFTSEHVDIPVYRVLDNDGTLVDPHYEVKLCDERLLKCYTMMSTLRVLDAIFYEMQRQGRISFYITSTGEEALQFGSAAALQPDDEVYGQYREPGIIMWRGFTLDQISAQCFSNADDLGKGHQQPLDDPSFLHLSPPPPPTLIRVYLLRINLINIKTGRQMPIHYGSAELHYNTISSPLATQIPQASGAAYALKLEGKERIAITYFGEGAASEGDFHAGLNFASTLKCPVLFFCRNNGYAISTPTKEQYAGDGVAPRAVGYGMASIRVDGNDLLAVHEATALARQKAISTNRPVLIEAMSYRTGHHSTSDDSTKYRDAEEIKQWQQFNNPLIRIRRFIEQQGLWNEEKEKVLQVSLRSSVMEALSKAEKRELPSISELFTDVYDEPPPLLRQQEQQMLDHLRKYAEHYNLDKFET